MATKTKEVSQIASLSLAQIAASIAGAAAPEAVTDFSDAGPASFTVDLRDAWAATVRESGIPVATVDAVQQMASNFEIAAAQYAADIIYNGARNAAEGSVLEGTVSYTLPSHSGAEVTINGAVDFSAGSMRHEMAIVRDTGELCASLSAHIVGLFA